MLVLFSVSPDDSENATLRSHLEEATKHLINLKSRLKKTDQEKKDALNEVSLLRQQSQDYESKYRTLERKTSQQKGGVSNQEMKELTYYTTLIIHF